MKTPKGAAAKSSHALAVHLRDGNAALYATADANPLRGSKALSSRRKDCAPRRSTADFGLNWVIPANSEKVIIDYKTISDDLRHRHAELVLAAGSCGKSDQRPEGGAEKAGAPTGKAIDQATEKAGETWRNRRSAERGRR